MKTKHILAGIGIVLFTSCTDYLDIKPYGRTIPKTAEEFSALMHNHLNNIDSGEDEDIVGNDIVTARGGEVVTIPLVEGYSTTDIINRTK